VNQDGLSILNSWKGDNRIKDTLPSSNYYQMNAGTRICLDLAKSLCELLGWQLTVNNFDGHDMKVQVNFLLDSGNRTGK